MKHVASMFKIQNFTRILQHIFLNIVEHFNNSLILVFVMFYSSSLFRSLHFFLFFFLCFAMTSKSYPN